jgi:hydroxymethylpyrimidine/phosphomethylpyrimidine kinase
LRDLLTASALGAHALVVGTAWTEQSKTLSIEARNPERVGAAVTAALAGVGGKSAVKIGMVATAPIAREILAALATCTRPVVFDPVLRATSGLALYDGDRDALLALARRATLLTPNLDEAGWLVGGSPRTLADARAAARALRDLGVPAVLVKGGHLEGEATDVLLSAAGESLYSTARVAGRSPRGTGCALATAIAARLAEGEPLETAVAAAKAWLTTRIERADDVGGERHL